VLELVLLSYIAHVDCCGLSTIVIKTIIIIYYYHLEFYEKSYFMPKLLV